VEGNVDASLSPSGAQGSTCVASSNNNMMCQRSARCAALLAETEAMFLNEVEQPLCMV
jgi:hypothetical protein